MWRMQYTCLNISNFHKTHYKCYILIIVAIIILSGVLFTLSQYGYHIAQPDFPPDFILLYGYNGIPTWNALPLRIGHYNTYFKLLSALKKELQFNTNLSREKRIDLETYYYFLQKLGKKSFYDLCEWRWENARLDSRIDWEDHTWTGRLFKKLKLLEHEKRPLFFFNNF